MSAAATCIANYTNGNLSDAKKQAERIPERDLFDAAILAGNTHSTAILIANYLKRPSQHTWDYLCKHKQAESK